MIRITVVDDNPEVGQKIADISRNFFTRSGRRCVVVNYSKPKELLWDIEERRGSDIYCLDIEMLYTLNEDACGLELFCDIENCAHQFSSVLTEPFQCPAALGNGYIIGSFENELYAAVNAAGWNLYQYSAEEKSFKPLNHILEIVDFEGAFYQNYFYYFSEGSLKRVALEQNAESEYVLENMAGSKEYRLGEMAFFDDHLIMNGSLTTIDSWIYNASENELIKADIELKTESAEYCAGKLYYVSPENILYSYTPENGNTEAPTPNLINPSMPSKRTR